MESSLSAASVFRRHIALPQDHGSWVFLLSPLLIGLFAGEVFHLGSLFLIVAALAGFLIRQPLTVAVKVQSRRRSRRDLPPALFWTAVYSLLGAAALIGLIVTGNSFVLLLAVPGAPVFAWHLALVSRRAERRQMGVELVATGVLALAAPAAYWVGIGQYAAAGWWLFVLTWFQSAASIVYAYLRLEQRGLAEMPATAERVRLGWRALLYTGFNFLAVLGLSLAEVLPAWLFLPYGLQWLETLYGTLVRPAVGAKPTAIGVRQLIVSSLFTLLFILTWNIG